MLNEKERKAHWETVYTTKQPHEVSWTQKRPQTSLAMVTTAGLDKSAKIIDIGGGDSKLVDHLLEEGYENITVLDISATALEKAKQRLGELSKKVKWVISDITQFQPETVYDFWHDRAAFHFLTTPEQIDTYKTIASQFVSGAMCIGTFSEEGPRKCSGLDILQYNEHSLTNVFKDSFSLINCIEEEHTTPFETQQQFIFCSFKKR